MERANLGDFSHLSSNGEANMVDISSKRATARLAVVSGRVAVSAICLEKLSENAMLEITRTARIAGINAAKQTHLLLPLCHQIMLNHIKIDINLDRKQLHFNIEVTSQACATTGVEMEGMTAATIAGVTIYDMIKAINPEAQVGPFLLVYKEGGKSEFRRQDFLT